MDVRTSEYGRDEWDALVNRMGGAFQQCWRYGQSVTCFPGRRVERHVVFQDGCPVMAAQMLIRQFPFGFEVGLVSRGPMFDPALPMDERMRVFQASRRQLKGRGTRILIITPEGDLTAPGFVPASAPGLLAELDLEPSLAELRGQLAGKWRNRLGFAERAKITVVDSRNLEWILQREAENRMRHRYRGPGADFFRYWQQCPDEWLLLQARHEGKPIAGALFFLHAGSASYQIGWSGAQGRKMNAQNLVMWSAIKALRTRGCRRLELGAIDPERAPGLARFKLGTGAEIVNLGPTRISVPVFGIGTGIARFTSNLCQQRPVREK